MDANYIGITVDNLKKWILLVGIFLCGTVLCFLTYDRAVPIRDMIWCATIIAILLCSKKILIGKIHFFALGYLLFTLLSVFAAINKSEWLYTTMRVVLVVSLLSVIDIDHKMLAKAMIALGTVFIVCFWIDRLNIGSFYHSRGLMRQRNVWAAAHFFILPFCYYAIKNGIWKKHSVLVAVCMVLHIVLLNSRSAMLAVGMSSIVVLPKRWLLPAVLTGIVIAIFFRGTLFDTASMHHRFEQWKYTMAMIVDNPLGVGAGNWKIEFPRYAMGIDYPGAFMNETYRFPHNDFLWVWSEIGVGIIFYVGMFAYALYSAKRYLVIGLVGYIVISLFIALADRTFPLVMMTVFIAMSCKRKPINQPKLLLTVLIFAMVVFGFRFRSSYWNLRVRKAKTPQAILNVAKGYSIFSTLTYVNHPWYWWSGINNYKIGQKNLACRQLQRSYKAAPNNINALNGMGIAKGIEGDREQAARYFKEALEICPEFDAAKINLEVLNRRAN